MNKSDFKTPPNHINFLAKKLFENCGEIEVASADDLETILDLQKKSFTEVAKLMNNYDLPPLSQTIEEIQNESENSIILKYSLEDGKII